jgi:hypothetical protein
MRMNRSTLALILISIAVIAGVLVLNNNNVLAPATTAVPTSPAVTGPLFADLDAESLTSLEIRDNATGDLTRLARAEAAEGEEAAWEIAEASFPQELDLDPAKVAGHIDTFVGMESVDQFPLEAGRAETFGLVEPAYTFTGTAGEGDDAQTYVVEVGARSQTSQRYYARINGDETIVHQILFSDVSELSGLVAQPPYVASPTPTATFTGTPNPFSEVEQTQTAEAAGPTLTAEFLTLIAPPPTATATPEATEADEADEITETPAATETPDN